MQQHNRCLEAYRAWQHADNLYARSWENHSRAQERTQMLHDRIVELGGDPNQTLEAALPALEDAGEGEDAGPDAGPDAWPDAGPDAGPATWATPYTW